MSMCYKDKTFCPFYLECINGKDCTAALTLKVEEDAKKWWKLISEEGIPPIAIYLDKPECFKEREL